MNNPKDLRNRLVPAPSWLELIEGDGPILLIAPHGGRSADATRTRFNPRVNDLYTAEITRELAHRLKATAIINRAMDRNLLDCNRVSQLVVQAPWLLDLIAEQAENTAARHGHLWVILIHGWNVTEPRLDFGLGARAHERSLRPVGSAHVAASEAFINGPLAGLTRRLSYLGIICTFGLRYPAGGWENLLQVFTPRHAASACRALQRLAAVAKQGVIDAVQIELSITLRLPGQLREHTLDAVSEAFMNHRTCLPKMKPVHETPEPMTIVGRSHSSAGKGMTTEGRAKREPYWLGLEFYDPEAAIGGMVSMALGPGGGGARVILVTQERRVIVFTGEGIARQEHGRFTIGPLTIAAKVNGFAARFCAPAVLVADGNAYLHIETALASAIVDNDFELELKSDDGPGFNLAIFAEAAIGRTVPFQLSHDVRASQSNFGLLVGHVRVAGDHYRLQAWSRIGFSLIAIGAVTFNSRSVLWTCFPNHPMLRALELREISMPTGAISNGARLFSISGSSICDLDALDIATHSPGTAPGHLGAVLKFENGNRFALSGHVKNFIPLARPGPNRTRIYTSLGFASFRFGEHDGVGMFEHSWSTFPRNA